jgi:hypothetical protein
MLRLPYARPASSRRGRGGTPRSGGTAPGSRAARTGLALTLLALSARRAAAQTDYYNTDLGRPLQVEDYLSLERYGLELQAAPLRVERARGGTYTWGAEPELAYGVLPRTHVEVGLPLAYVDASAVSGGHASGLAGVDVSIFHQLNVETAIPGLAVVGDVLLPAGGLAPAKSYLSAKGIATRTLSRARFHANAQYTFGPSLPAAGAEGAEDGAPDGGAVELSRWLAGLAVDKTFPLRSLLVGGELTARAPLRHGADTEMASAVGARYQLGPRWNVDAGVGLRLTGDAKGWYATFGTAYAFGLPFLISGARR